MTEKEYNRLIKYIDENQFVGRYADGWNAWCCDCVPTNKLKAMLKSMRRSTIRIEEKQLKTKNDDKLVNGKG